MEPTLLAAVCNDDDDNSYVDIDDDDDPGVESDQLEVSDNEELSYIDTDIDMHNTMQDDSINTMRRMSQVVRMKRMAIGSVTNVRCSSKEAITCFRSAEWLRWILIMDCITLLSKCQRRWIGMQERQYESGDDDSDEARILMAKAIMKTRSVGGRGNAYVVLDALRRWKSRRVVSVGCGYHDD